MKATLVGFAGRRRHGKNTAAEALVSHGFALQAFADPLRSALAELDPWLVDSEGSMPPRRWSEVIEQYGYEGAKASPYGASLTETMQRFGTETCRATFGIDCWVEAALRRMPVGPVAFTDVRFRNEADFIQNHGGLVVLVQRPVVADDREPVAQHASEALDLDPDIVVVNDGTVADLHTKVLDALGIH